MTEALCLVSFCALHSKEDDLRLDGGAADEDGRSSSGSLERLRPLRAGPLLAADILGRSGELDAVQTVSVTGDGGFLGLTSLQ